MVTKEEIKKERTKKKAALTRMGSKVRRLIAEKNQEEVKKCIDDMKGLYLEFEAKHDELYEMLDEDEDDDEMNECEIDQLEVEAKYTEVLCEVNNWTISLGTVKEEQPIFSRTVS